MWHFIAELLGFGGAILLVWPAFSLSGYLRRVESTMTTFKTAKTPFGKEVGAASLPTLQNARTPRWSTFDQGMLYSGIGLLALSFLIKMFLVYNSSPS